MNERRAELAAKQRYDINDLMEIMTILRSDDGCPWDKEQTHKSIRGDLIEETYEAIEAIDTDDMVLMREELGDVLLQVIFHCRIAQEDGYFDFSDVVSDLCQKLVERHEHIFGDFKADTTEKVLTNWEKIKQNSKGRESTVEILNGVSKALPSLIRAGKLSKKAAKAGCFELSEGSVCDDEYEIGKKLFEITAHAEKSGINAEEALYKYCDEFIAEIDEREKIRKLQKY